jgi:hypothetical protein
VLNRILVKMEPQEDLPEGDTWKCRVCRTRVRLGQPHTAVEPWPHSTLEAMTTFESKEWMLANGGGDICHQY